MIARMPQIRFLNSNTPTGRKKGNKVDLLKNIHENMQNKSKAVGRSVNMSQSSNGF